eukprot:NODE_630_length_5208_cov_0.377178.p4 type:complete len:103 gc:universal NODE_630_length_5208_cov_0.377178:1799-2107(+)
MDRFGVDCAFVDLAEEMAEVDICSVTDDVADDVADSVLNRLDGCNVEIVEDVKMLLVSICSVVDFCVLASVFVDCVAEDDPSELEIVSLVLIDAANVEVDSI